MRGRFTVQKTSRYFSRISDDQAHEQNNKIAKGNGGAIGIFDSPISLAKWMISGPDIAHMISIFEEDAIHSKPESPEYKHHENTESFENHFRKNFLSLKEEFIKAGNPFEETSETMYTLVSKNILNLEAKKSVYEARTLGKNKYHQYKHNIFILGRKNVYETLKRNKLSLFRNKNTVTISKTQLKVTSLKQDCRLFSSLFVACQSRDGDMAQFFAHENHTYPPALSVYGNLRIAQKSDKLKILFNISEPVNIQPTCTAEVLDGAVVVQCIVPRASSNFDQYYNTEFLSFVSQKYNSYQLSRFDIVFDVYLENTIKASASAKRGVGKRIKVTASTPLPKNWKMFLHVNENKTELFHLIAATIKNYKGNEKIVVTKDNCVLSIFRLRMKLCHRATTRRLIQDSSNSQSSINGSHRYNYIDSRHRCDCHSNFML